MASFEVRELFAELSVGREFGQWGEARVGVRYSDGEAERRVGDTAFEDLPFERGEAFVRLSLDEYDDFNFPRSGSRVVVEWTGSRGGLGADDNFDQLSINAGKAFTRNRNTLVLNGLYNATISGTAPVQSLNGLGSFLRLSGFTRFRLRDQNAALVSAIGYRQINTSVPVAMSPCQ